MTAALAAAAAALLYLHHLISGPLFQPFLPKDMARPPVAIISFSGDLGVDFGLTGSIAKRFRKAGVPVIAVNSHDYFTRRRTPAEVAALLDQAMARATATTGAHRFVLLGQSYGADMLHVALSSLPEADRASVAAVALVVPGQTLFFKIDWRERYDLKPPEAMAIDSARRLTWAPTLCIQGAEETTSLCPLLAQPNVERLTLPGGHLLHHDADAAFSAVKAFYDRHAA